jgi:pyrroloquinoline quinone (PQQ) biosynthesis protein C
MADVTLGAEVATAKAPDAFIEELWGYARALEMKEHPWFKGVREHRWTREQIVRAEMQHYLRVRMNPIFFGYIVTSVVAEKNYELMPIVMENFMEELGGEKTHVDVMLQFLEEAGITREQADAAEPAPGTMAAIEMIVGCCQRRTALEGIAMLSFVEAMHGGPDGAAAGMFEAMTKHYGFSAKAAATYELHAEQDTGHGDRQIEAIRRFARDAETQEKVRAAVKLGLEAFNFEWDGHVQAMTGERTYWRGLAPRIELATPEFRLPR